MENAAPTLPQKTRKDGAPGAVMIVTLGCDFTQILNGTAGVIQEKWGQSRPVPGFCVSLALWFATVDFGLYLMKEAPRMRGHRAFDHSSDLFVCSNALQETSNQDLLNQRALVFRQLVNKDHDRLNEPRIV